MNQIPAPPSTVVPQFGPAMATSRPIYNVGPYGAFNSFLPSPVPLSNTMVQLGNSSATYHYHGGHLGASSANLNMPMYQPQQIPQFVPANPATNSTASFGMSMPLQSSLNFSLNPVSQAIRDPALDYFAAIQANFNQLNQLQLTRSKISKTNEHILNLMSSLKNNLASLAVLLSESGAKAELDAILCQLSPGSVEDNIWVSIIFKALYALGQLFEHHVPRITKAGTTVEPTAFVVHLADKTDQLALFLAKMFQNFWKINNFEKFNKVPLISLATNICFFLFCSAAKLGERIAASTLASLIDALLPYALQGDSYLQEVINNKIDYLLRKVLFFDIFSESGSILDCLKTYRYLNPSVVLCAILKVMQKLEVVGSLRDALEFRDQEDELGYLDGKISFIFDDGDEDWPTILTFERFGKLEEIFLEVFKLWGIYTRFQGFKSKQSNNPLCFSTIQEIVSSTCYDIRLNIVDYLGLVAQEVIRLSKPVEHFDMLTFIGDCLSKNSSEFQFSLVLNNVSGKLEIVQTNLKVEKQETVDPKISEKGQTEALAAKQIFNTGVIEMFKDMEVEDEDELM